MTNTISGTVQNIIIPALTANSLSSTYSNSTTGVFLASNSLSANTVSFNIIHVNGAYNGTVGPLLKGPANGQLTFTVTNGLISSQS